MFEDRCGWLWVVVDHCGIVVDRCGSLWVVVDRCGLFRVLVTTNNCEKETTFTVCETTWQFYYDYARGTE